MELYVNIQMVIDSPNQYKSQWVLRLPSADSELQLPDEAWYIIIIPKPIKNGDMISSELSVGAERTLYTTNAKKANAGNSVSLYLATTNEIKPRMTVRAEDPV